MPRISPSRPHSPRAARATAFSAALHREEGWNELCKQVKLAERFDIAIMSCKGQSVIAARKMVDQFCGGGESRFWCCTTSTNTAFRSSSVFRAFPGAAEESGCVAYRFKNDVNAVDLGLRLEDVEKWDLQSERCYFSGGFDGADYNVTEAEINYLSSGRRVELNAFTHAQFVDFVEEKLAAPASLKR